MTEGKQSMETPEDKELETFRKSVAPNTGKTSILTVAIVGGAILAFTAFFYGITHQYENAPTAPSSTTP